MININKHSKRRAVSPVIATVILVAVAITVSVGVSYWMSSIAGQYTAFEKVEIQSGYATKTVAGTAAVLGDNPATTPEVETDFVITPATDAEWKITIKLKNTGSAPSTITSCFINEKPIEEYAGAITMTPIEVTLESGETDALYIDIVQTTDVTFTSGTTVNVKLHSASGMDYIKLIRLS